VGTKNYYIFDIIKNFTIHNNILIYFKILSVNLFLLFNKKSYLKIVIYKNMLLSLLNAELYKLML